MYEFLKNMYIKINFSFFNVAPYFKIIVMSVLLFSIIPLSKTQKKLVILDFYSHNYQLFILSYGKSLLLGATGT